MLLLERGLFLRLHRSRVTLRRPVLVRVSVVPHVWVWLIVHLLGMTLGLVGLLDNKGLAVVGSLNRGLVDERLPNRGLHKRLLGKTLVGERDLMLVLPPWHVDFPARVGHRSQGATN